MEKIKARFIGKYTIIEGDVEIGEGTWVGNWVNICGLNAPIKIGKNCDISNKVVITDHSTHLRCTQSGKKIVAPIIIEDNVFIGTSVVISPRYDSVPVIIGYKSIIGALSLLMESIPAYSKVKK